MPSSAKPRRSAVRGTAKPSFPVVAISMGDPSGIGPEIVAKALEDPRVRASLVPVVLGDAGALERFPSLESMPRVALDQAKRSAAPAIVTVSNLPASERKPGKPALLGGRAQLAYVEAAIALARAGQVDAICTAPVSKEQISRSGVHFMGHTEVLADAFGADVLMMMDGPRLRVALATNHVAIKDLPSRLERKKLTQQLQLLDRSLRPVVKRAPKIAVCGLNPHAGEGGYLGREELDVIGPAIADARKKGVKADGPFPADGLMARELTGRRYDVVLVMFHDQGLVAAKVLDFDRTVNVTLGLPVPRTSPDHGVAYDIAGKNKASAVPMIEALLRAVALVPSKRPRG